MIKSLSLRTTISIGLVVVALAGSLVGFGLLASLREPPSPRQKQEQVLNVEGFRVTPVRVQEMLSAFGTARADRQVTIATEVAGQAVWVHDDLEVGHDLQAAPYPPGEVDSNSPQGDLIVRIDPTVYRDRIAQIAAKELEEVLKTKQTEVEVQQAEDLAKKTGGELENFKAEYERRKQLVETGVGTQSELTRSKLELQQYEKSDIRAKSEWDLAKIRLKQSDARLKSLAVDKRLAQEDLAHTEIRPPFSGFVSEVFVELGQYLRPGDPIVTLTDINRVEIPVSLTLSDFSRIKSRLERGQKPEARLALHEDQPAQWTGHVVRSAPVADERTRTIEVYIEVDNRVQAVPLLPGTFVHATIEGPVYEPGEVYAVPRDAIVGDRVLVIEDGEARSRDITVLETLQSLALVQAGLNGGDLLVLTNLDVLTDGAKVDAADRLRDLTDELDRLGSRMTNLRIIDDAPPAGE